MTTQILALQRKFAPDAQQQSENQPGREQRKYTVEQQERDLDELIQILTEAKHKVAAERDRALRELKLPWYFEDLEPTR